MRVMVVDDSVVFRSQLKNCLDGADGITMVTTAANGKIALDRLTQEGSDLIILDMEMPEMDGIQFLAEFRKRNHHQPVIVFAAPNKNGAQQVLTALAAGASDFIAKPAHTFSLEEALEGIKRELLPKIIQFKNTYRMSNEKQVASVVKQSSAKPQTLFTAVLLETFKPRIIVIGSSTGGPSALEKLFSALKGKASRVPILIAQHMPPNFTEALARRLEVVSGIPAGEGRPGELVQPGRIYVAPGDYHMSLQRLPDKGSVIIKLDQQPKRNSVRPAVDFLFESAAKEYGANCAGFVLTGMGEDGKDGSIAIKQASGAVMIQDRESSVVWGMPGAVHASGAFDGEGDIDACAKILTHMAQ